MPTFCVYSHTPLQVSCQYATGHRIRELLFSCLGNVCIGRICLLAFAVLPCVLFCTILSCDDTPKDTELTLLGGNKSQLWGNWAERCNPSVSQPFKQQLQWVSMTVNLDTLGCPLSKVRQLNIYTNIWSSKPPVRLDSPKCHISLTSGFFLPIVPIANEHLVHERPLRD